MQVSIETTEGLERKMTVAVPSDRVEGAVNARLQEAAKTIRLNGFRKGKVPLKVVKGRFGKGVRQEVVGELMSQSYYEAISQESLKPAGQPKIEPTNLDEGKDLEFTAIFEVYPEVELPDFSAIEVERLTGDVTESDIDEMIESLRQQRQGWSEVDRAAASGDMVNIDFAGTRDGEAFEGGTAADTNLVLGSKRMIPGFEEGIEGKSVGESFDLTLSFPEDYQAAELAGQEVVFAITLNKVSEQSLPEVDEEFFASFGVTEGGMDAFREEVESNMRREMKTASRNKVKNAVMDKVIDAVDFTVPGALVAAEIQQLKAQALQQMGGGQGMDPSMLPDELFSEQASRRVSLGLVLGEVISTENLNADPARVRERIEEVASTYESPEEVVNWYYSNEEQLSGIESAVLEDQVFDLILDKAKVADKEVGYQEVIKQEAKAAPEAAEEGQSAEAADEGDAEAEEKGE